MADIPWMVPGTRSGLLLIDNPDEPADVVSGARDRLDAAVGAVENPIGPRWFHVVSRIGRWWYLLWAVVLAVLFQFTEMEVAQAIVVGIAVGISVAGLSGVALAAISRGVSVTAETRRAADRAREAEYPHVRTVMPGLADAVNTILAHDPALAPRVHALAWQLGVARENDPVDEAVAQELFDLQDAVAGGKAS